MNLRQRSAIVGVATILAFASVARAQSLDGGEFKTQGSATKGAYTGTAKLTKGSDGQYHLNAQMSYAGGGARGWTGSGKLSGGTLTLKGTVNKGLIGGLNPFSKKVKITATYSVSADGKTLKGSWKSSDNQAGTETLSRAGSTPPVTPPNPNPSGNADLLTLVDGSGKDVAKDKKNTDGVLLAVNFDDDDNDGGAAGDGDTKIVPDFQDKNGVSGENDLLPVKLKKPATAAADAKFRFVYGSNLALWSTKDKQPNTVIESGKEIAATDATFYVEGISPSDGAATLSVELVSGGQTVAKDSGAIWVARPAFLLIGHGNSGRWAFDSWLSSHAADSRKDPVLVRGKDDKGKPCAWAGYVWDTEKKAKIALSQPGAVIAYDGHSNFGMGFAFQTNFKSLKQFLNIADPQIPVNWEYLRDHQEHPSLIFEDSEYGDDSSTSTFSDPARRARTITGAHGSYDTARYPTTASAGDVRLSLTRGTNKWLDHHYGSEDNWRIVVKAGSRDMPTKNWSKIFLNSCYSGQYYYDSFGGKGTLFFTHEEASSSQTSAAFLEGCIEGKSNEQILKDVNSYENINDFYSFGN